MNSTIKFEILKKTSDFKTIKITGRSGDMIEAHKVDFNSMLYVKEGFITYKEKSTEQALYSDQAHQIPANMIHEVIFNDDSQIIIITPSKSIIKFVN